MCLASICYFGLNTRILFAVTKWSTLLIILFTYIRIVFITNASVIKINFYRSEIGFFFAGNKCAYVLLSCNLRHFERSCLKLLLMYEYF